MTPPQTSLQSRQSVEFFFFGAISFIQIFITVPLCVICLSQNLYICYLRSGQSRDLYITSLWKKIMKCALLRVNESKPPNSLRIMSDYLICNDSGGIY